MKAEDTIKKAGELCRTVCLEHRSATLEAKNCDGLDCEVCQLTKQAEISFKAGQGDTDFIFQRGHKAGIKEVVEWIREQEHLLYIPPDNEEPIDNGIILRIPKCII